MENLAKDLSIPLHQIKQSSNEGCFVVAAHRLWLKNLSNGMYTEFIRRQDDSTSLSTISWCSVHVKVYGKNPQKVIPLTRSRATDGDDSNLPLTYSQLMHFVSQTNHRNLWKAAFKKYVQPEVSKPLVSDERPVLKRTKSSNELAQNLLSHDVVLRNLITRIYACQIIDTRVEVNRSSVESDDGATTTSSDGFAHPNLYPIIAVIETHNNFFVIHQPFVQYTLRDCINYSPAILNQSHNKPLFIIYQLINLLRSMHDRSMLWGSIGLEDIYLTENLWMQVIPKLDKNVLIYEDWIEQHQEQFEMRNPPITRHLSTSCVSEFGKVTVPLMKIDRNMPIKYSLNDYCKMWCHGELSNFDYLTILNDLSGRQKGNPQNSYIFPWVTDFSARNGLVWRDLTKSKYRLNKGDAQLDFTFQSLSMSTSSGSSLASAEMPHHVSDVLSEITYYVYMARRTPKTLLCKHVRPIFVAAEYPCSIQRLQAWSPDECIPEFYSDPLVFKSTHEDLPDLEVPIWSSCPEDFIMKHREALESQNVSEKLNNWIDLTFGYKLTGDAAVKAKNVCLSMVDGHKNLCQNGVIQLFFNPHPPKQFPSVWTGKVPPRIYLHSDSRKRLTRSSEDLSHSIDNYPYPDCSTSPSSSHRANSSSSANNSRATPDSQKRSIQHPESLERSPSYHVNVQQRTPSTIVLPKNYNPIAQLQNIENMELFLSKTFHNVDNQQIDNPIETLHTKETAAQLPFESQDCGNATDGYTNRIFSQNYEALLCKENKMIQNLRQQRGCTFPKSKRTQKQLMSELKIGELQMLGCLIVELFLSAKLRAMTGCAETVKDFEKRLNICVRVLKHESESLPSCVQYPVKLLLGLLQNEEENSVITNIGLPVPSAQQLLQPILSNSLIPFSHNYIKLFTLVKSLHQFDETQRLLELQTFFECDGKHCSQFETMDRSRTAFTRKIAECKVKSTALLIEGLLEINPHEQFRAVDLLLPHIIDLLRNNETSILAAWYIFDPVAQCLGVVDTQKHLLAPILALYDVDTGDRTDFRTRNSDSLNSNSGNSSFKSRKAIKLYHHSFLQRLIVRFGLRCFLENFTTPLIEAVGGKDPESDSPHLHEFRASRSQRNLKLNNNEVDLTEDANETSNTLVSPNDASDKSSDKTLSPSSQPTIAKPEELPQESEPHEEIFAFEGDEVGKSLKVGPHNPDDSSDTDAEQAILKIIDQFELKSDGSSIDLKFNHSQAEEAFETTSELLHDNFQINEFIYGEDADQTKLFSSSCYSFDEDKVSNKSADSSNKVVETSTSGTVDLKSPTIPIPSSFRKSIEVNSIGCEIGSRKSIDSADFLSQTPQEYPKNSVSSTCQVKPKTGKSTEPSSMYTSAASLRSSRSCRMSEMSSESLIWLSHRLGPVLTARYITKNLLKMLTLCYVGQENLLPDASLPEPNAPPNLLKFTIAEGRVNGDNAAAKVLEVLVAVSALFGEQFILLQYFPVAIELIALCKKKITPSLEGGLISSLQLVKYLIPYLNDVTIMDQLSDVILRGVLHPIIRILASTKLCMPSGYLARNVLARKLLDCIYVLSVRIGPEMTKEHLDLALQRFFLIFDKAYGISDNVREERSDPKNPAQTTEDSFLEIRRDGLIQEWSIQGERISHARLNSQDSLESYTPPYWSASTTSIDPNATIRDRATEEIRDVFTPALAHTSYLKFLKHLRDDIMCHMVKNIPLILNLCHEHQQVLNDAKNFSDYEHLHRKVSLEDSVDGVCSNSFGKNVIGNRIEVSTNDNKSEVRADDLIGLVAYKLENVNSARNLRGNWMAYWEHECGRSDKDNHFNFKQIKLQTFSGHSNSVRAILALDNENSFLSASKDKTVKLWSLRSEGDGNKISSCQFTYLNHRKSVQSLAFLESFRWAVSCDSGVHIWDPYMGQHVGQLDTNKHSPVSVVKTYPSPSALVICGTADSSVKFIDARTFKYINEWNVAAATTTTVRCIAVSPSQNWIAVGLNSGQIVLLDGRTGMVLASWKACDGEILQLIAPNENQLISSGLDCNISVWSTLDGSLLFNMKSPPEPAHCLLNYNQELIIGTPANRIGVYSQLSSEAAYSFTKLRSETFRGVLTHLQILPLNRTLLIGGDSGNITLFC